MTAAIIIARGGSIRLPRKNVKLMNGLPLVAWTIIQAECSHLIDQVYLSTDDDEIAEIGVAHGAEIIRRPDWPNPDLLAGGHPTAHAVGIIKEEHGDEFDTMLSIMPTTPCRLPHDLDRVVAWSKECGEPRAVCYLRAPLQEICASKETKPGRHVVVYGEYGFENLGGCAQVACMTPERYLEIYNAYLKHDAEVRAGGRYKLDYREDAHVDGKAWQAADCDTLEEFEFTELVFEHFILRGKGRAVYDEYAEAGPRL